MLGPLGRPALAKLALMAIGLVPIGHLPNKPVDICLCNFRLGIRFSLGFSPGFSPGFGLGFGLCHTTRSGFSK